MKTILLILTLLFTPISGFCGVEFNGVDTVIAHTANDNVLTENGAMTISVMAVPYTDGEGNSGCFVTRGTSATTHGVNFCISATNAVVLFVNGTTSLNHTSVNGAFTLNRLSNFIVKWDGSTTAANARIFVDGVEVSSYATTTNGVTIGDNSGDTLRIGNRSALNQCFNGNISEVAIWNAQLTDKEIATIGKSRVKGLPLGIQRQSLVFYAPMKECTDRDNCTGTNKILDFSGSNNFGTPAGGCLGRGDVIGYQ